MNWKLLVNLVNRWPWWLKILGGIFLIILLLVIVFDAVLAVAVANILLNTGHSGIQGIVVRHP